MFDILRKYWTSIINLISFSNEQALNSIHLDHRKLERKQE